MEVAVGVIFGAAAIAPLIDSLFNRWAGVILALLPLALTTYFASLIPRIAAGAVIQTNYPWVPSLDIGISFSAGWAKPADGPV